MMLRFGGAAAIAALVMLAAATARTAPTDIPANAGAALDAARQECVAAARTTQERERAGGALRHRIDLRERDAAATKRDIDSSRPEQARFLGTLEFLARNLKNPQAAAALPPADRRRGELLIDAMMPGLQAQAHALSGELARIATLQAAIAADRHELGNMQAALGKDRERLEQLVAHRLEQMWPLLPKDSADARLGEGAKAIDDLIKAADAAAERRDRARAARAHTGKAAPPAADNVDPTRPRELHAFDPPQSVLTPPVSGSIGQPFGASDASDVGKQGMEFAAPSAAIVVAPFDGRVIYAGSFRSLGLVLIIQHGRLYHSLLTGLGRADASLDQWVLAGEPVGAMPIAADGAVGRPLYFELRRDGRPVDPQQWLASDDEGRGTRNGDEKVRQ